MLPMQSPQGDPTRMKCWLLLCWPSLIPPEWERGAPHCSLVKVEVSAPQSTFAGGMGPQFFSVATVWSRAVTDKVFLSCWAIPFLVLWLERASEQAFCWGFYCLCLWVFLTSSAPHLGYMRQNKNSGDSLPCPSLGAKFLACLLPSFSVTVCLFYIEVQGFSLYLMVGVRESISTLSSRQSKSQI